MRRIRIYSPIALLPNQQHPLHGEAAHHLLTVLRKKLGERFIIFNGDGFEYPATIVSIDKKSAVLQLGDAIDPVNESPVSLHLAQGISRGDRMDFAIQKAVELGVNEITPLITLHTQIKLDNSGLQKKRVHWEAIAIAACEQSGRCKIPAIHPPQPFTSFIANSVAEQKYICAFTQKTISMPTTAQSAIVMVGPEGGFHEKEVAQAIAQGYQAMSLGPRVLRTETAAIVALTRCQEAFGDM